MVLRAASLVDRARRMARVFFARKSMGLYFLPLYSLRKLSFVFVFMTMYTRAMALRTTRLEGEGGTWLVEAEQIGGLICTTHILESLDAAPPVTFWTRRLRSSVLRSSSCLDSSFLSFVRSSEHLTLT